AGRHKWPFSVPRAGGTLRSFNSLRALMASLTRKHLLHMRAALVALALVAYSVVAQDRSGRHDLDFLFGDWQVHHQRLKARLAGSTEGIWVARRAKQSAR